MEDWKSYLANTEIIVHAGGLSERWAPVTEGKLPKSVTEIGKKPRPVIDWCLLPYVKSGIKKFFVTLWHNPEPIISHCEEIKKQTGIQFVYLKEPAERRLGKAGVIKYYLWKTMLDMNNPKININASDIINYNLEDFTKFHLEGLQKGFTATILGSRVGSTQFDKLIFQPNTKQLLRMEDKPPVKLPEGEAANTGMLYFDSKLSKLFLEINENELPVDWEKCSISSDIFKASRCFAGVELFNNWFALKASHDYKRVKDLDFEKWFGIDSVEKYLGEYSSSL